MKLKNGYKQAVKAGALLNARVAMEDDMISINGWVTMRRSEIEVERRSIKGLYIDHVDGWVIEYARHTPSVGDIPADVDIWEEGRYEHWADALKRALNLVHEDLVARVVQNLQTAELADDLVAVEDFKFEGGA